MDRSLSLQQFLESARNQGLSDDVLVGLLRGHGWPEADIYRALAENYEGRTGVQIPAYKRSGSAKDAFLYLLSFSTLATWTIGLGSIMFDLIERWIRDPLGPTNNYYQSGYYQMADSLACVLVAFPVYIFVMAYIVRTVEAHPEKRDSPVRKWLTYIALLIAAGIVVGDLIAFLTYFLRGELTARFVSKVATVLVLAGGVFWYYMGSLQSATGEKPR
ncbi:MAG TPA: DUF5671 domain-containing protein [Candidatus Acidoferrum sp.]|nr:DUF5671 domain-containing protein [Candidatus Acidoferrum sp.]